MTEKAMRKWGAWVASALMLILTAVLGISQSEKAEAKGAPSVRSSATQPVAASEGESRIADADRDGMLELQLD